MNDEMRQERGEDRARPPRVLLAAAECAPLSKTGGLADVIGALPKSLKRLGVDCRVITPFHHVVKQAYASRTEHLFQFYVDLGWRHEYVGIEKLELDGIVYYLVDNERYGLDDEWFTDEWLMQDGCADYLKAGCLFADRINTVSPGYAAEIRTPEYGEGLDEILNARADVLSGILNGIDHEVFNPADDAFLPVCYDSLHREGKTACKEALQQRMGLEVRPDVPIFAMVTRMTEQKGFELIQCMLDDFMLSEDVQFMLVGSGDERFENFMRAAEGRYRGRLCAYLGYNEEAAHLTYAGSDFFLMPSRFEPCGLGQMIAMRYGSIPVVRATGGLKDTVKAYDPFTGTGNGFLFEDFDAWQMRDAIRQAISAYRNRALMARLIGNAMREDFGFEHTAKAYLRLYLRML